MVYVPPCAQVREYDGTHGVCGGGCSEVVGRLLALFDVGADAVDLGVKFEKVLATKIDRAQRAML